MKQQKEVITQNDLPQKFGWEYWTIVYLLLKELDANFATWLTASIFFGIWTIAYFYAKSNEKPFSVVSFKKNIDKWISE